jgi:hypothetical protein
MRTTDIQAICFWYGIIMALIFWHGGKKIPAMAGWENRAKFGFWFGAWSLWFCL